MIIEFLKSAIALAKYEQIEDGIYYAEIDGFDGVWANGKTKNECQKELEEVLDEWLILKLKQNANIPKVQNYNLNLIGS